LIRIFLSELRPSSTAFADPLEIVMRFLFLGRRNVAQLSLKRVNSLGVARQHLQLPVHLHDHSIVEDIVIVHVLGGSLLKVSGDLLLDHLAALVLFLPVFLKNSVDSFLNCLLVALLSNLDDLANTDVLKLVLEQVDLTAMLLDLLIRYDVLLEDSLLPSELLVVHVKTPFAAVVVLDFVQALLEFFLLLGEKLLTSNFDQLVSNLLGESHHVIQRDRFLVFDDSKLVLIENLTQRWVFLDNVAHFSFAEYFKHRWSSESEIDGATLFHEECAVVDDATLEKSLNDKLLVFELGVNLDHTALQEVKFIGVSSCLLKLSTLDHGLGVEQVDNIVKDGVVGCQVLEIGYLLHRTFDEVEHLVVVLVDASFDLVLDLRLHCNDLTVTFHSQLTQVAILFCLDSGRSKTIVNDRNLSEKVTRTQQFLFFLFLVITLFPF